MAIRDILNYPDSRLRTVAKPVDTVDDVIRGLVEDMFDTMYEAPGIGLAATQIDVHQRVVVMDLTEDRSEPQVFINPEILDSGGSCKGQEGCLSIPGYYDDVPRAEWVHVRAVDQHGQAFELETDGLLAVCIQHEIDHLDGKLFIDYLSELKRKRVRKKLEKQARHASTA